MAEACIISIHAGGSHIAGSLKTKIMGQMSRVTPDGLAAEMHRKLSAPGAAKSKPV